MIAGCRSIQLSHLPDNVDGAYVFRNGAAEVLRLDVRVYDSVAASPKCSFAWDKTRADFVPTTH